MCDHFSLSISLTNYRVIFSNNVEVDEKKATGRKIRGAGRENLTKSLENGNIFNEQ